jgi:hypothetical protein
MGSLGIVLKSSNAGKEVEDDILVSEPKNPYQLGATCGIFSCYLYPYLWEVY